MTIEEKKQIVNDLKTLTNKFGTYISLTRPIRLLQEDIKKYYSENKIHLKNE